jgi:hypothetical protein
VSAFRGGSGRKIASRSEHSEPQLGYVADHVPTPT